MTKGDVLNKSTNPGRATGWIGVGAAWGWGFVVGTWKNIRGRLEQGKSIRSFARDYVSHAGGRRAAWAEDFMNAVVSFVVGLVAGQKLDVLSWLSLGALSPPLGIVLAVVLVIVVWFLLFIGSHAFFRKALERVLGEKPSVAKASRLFLYYLVPLLLMPLVSDFLGSLGLFPFLNIFILVITGSLIPFLTFNSVRSAHNQINGVGLVSNASPSSAINPIEETLKQTKTKLKQMKPGHSYTLLVSGLEEMGQKERFLRKRTAEEIVQSGLSSGCFDDVLVFYDEMAKMGYRCKIIDAVKVTYSSFRKRNSGHAVVAVRLSDDDKWILADPTSATIIDSNWDTSCKFFRRKRGGVEVGPYYYIGFAGELQNYRIADFNSLRIFYQTTLESIENKTLLRLMRLFDFRRNEKIEWDEGLKKRAEDFISRQNTRFAEFEKIRQMKFVRIPIMISPSLTYDSASALRGNVLQVGSNGAMSDNLLDFIENSLERIPVYPQQGPEYPDGGQDGKKNALIHEQIGKATSKWGLKLAEWIGSKVDPGGGREWFGMAYRRFAAMIEWGFSAMIAFWGFMGTLAIVGAPLGWAIAPAVGTVYGILFVASHFIIPDSMAPVTKVNVGVVQAWTMGVLYGVLIGATPFLLGAVPLLGVPEIGVQAAGVLWGLAGSLHFSFDKATIRKEGKHAAWKLIEQLSHVQGAFETVMPGIQNEHTEQIVGKGSVSTDGMTEMLSRLKTDREYRAGFVEAVQTALGDSKVSGASKNLLSSMVMAATGQPLAYVHVLGNSPAQELQTLERLIEREGKIPSGFSVALVVSESQKNEFKTMIDVFEARGVAVFSVDIKEHGWSKEVLMGLDDKMSTFLEKANGIVATVGEKVGINLADVEALSRESKLKAALMNALTFGEVVEAFLRVLQALASNA